MATETSDSPQVKLIHEWRQGFQTRNLDLIAKALHKDFRFIISPQSLGRPEQTREEWLERYKGILNHYTADPESTIHSIIDTPGRVVTHMTNKSKTSFGEVNRELIVIADIVTDEDGSLKIKKIEEFTDSKAYLDFHQAIAAKKQ